MKGLTLLFLVSVISVTGLAQQGARSKALAGSGVLIEDVWACYNNQAALGFVKNVSAGVYFENRFLMKELSTRSLALALPVKGGSLGLTFSDFGYTAYSEKRAGLAYGRMLTDKLAVGVQLNYLSYNLGDVYGKKGVVAGEFGMLYKPIKNWIMAVHIFNPTLSKLNSYNNERVPTVFKAATGYYFNEKVLACARVEKEFYAPVSLSGGIEYCMVKEFFFRTGYDFGRDQFALGCGVYYKQFSSDLAFTYHPVLGVSPAITLQWGVEDK